MTLSIDCDESECLRKAEWREGALYVVFRRCGSRETHPCSLELAKRMAQSNSKGRFYNEHFRR
jgi:hypothetical protein